LSVTYSTSMVEPDMEKERQIQISVRVPEAWIARLERIANAMPHPGLASGNMALAHRHSLELGMAQAEAEYGIKTPAAKKGHGK
jgi:hypothetical protein